MTKKERTPLPWRILPMEALYNVRELGGYPAFDGRRVKRGLLYRAGDLYAMTGKDRSILEGKGIKTIVDFRGDEERARSPDKLPGTVVSTWELTVDPANVIDLSRMKAGTSGEAMMEELYRVLVDEARPAYRQLFRLLTEIRNSPLLFHCSAGKDRTGLAAALILFALGTDRETIYEDYCLSGACLKDKYAGDIAASPHLEPLMTVRRSYLDAAFERIDQHYDGPENYLRRELGANIEVLRELYTEAGD
jgi:protein-tyrosine phosphatase